MVPNKPLRFAAYMRVSEDEQRDYGKSLETQWSRVQAAVEQLGGEIVEKYGGSEHAMPGYVRGEFDRLIADAETGYKFDAICLADAQRWSRDTVASKLAVRRLKRSRIRLFFGTVEQDLRSPTTQLALTLAAEVSETETNARHDASLFGRVEQAALGFASSGLPPYGRSVPASLVGTRRIWSAHPDGTAKWQIDPEAQRYVERAANLYLSGKTWAEVGQILGDDENTVRRRVAAAGGTWHQRFHLRDYRPEDFAKIRFRERLLFEGDLVTVTTPVPALLEDAVLDRVRAKAAAHYEDRHAPNKQALGGYLRCENCGGSIGTHYHASTGAVYLQHNGRARAGCPSNFGRYEPVERSFLRHLSALLQDQRELELSVREALLAETTRQPQIHAELLEAKAKHLALSREHDDLYAKVKALNLADTALAERLAMDAQRLDGNLRATARRVTELEDSLKITQLPPDFTERTAFTLFCLRGYGTNTRWLWTWAQSQRRQLIQFLFGHAGRRPLREAGHGVERSGIYLARRIDEHTGKPVIAWTAKGWFPQVSDQVWLDPKVVQHFAPLSGPGRIDGKRLVDLVRRLDVRQFRFARLAFNAAKLEGTRARS